MKKTKCDKSEVRRGVEQQKEKKEEWIHKSPYCDTENKQADGLIVSVRRASHLGTLIPLAWLGEKSNVNKKQKRTSEH